MSDDFKARGYHSKSEMRRMEAQKPEAPRDLPATGEWSINDIKAHLNDDDEKFWSFRAIRRLLSAYLAKREKADWLETEYLRLSTEVGEQALQLETAQKEIAELKGEDHRRWLLNLKAANESLNSENKNLFKMYKAERAKVESLLKENDALRAGSPAFQRAAELQAKVSELEADVALLKKEKSSLMRSLAKFTGNA